MASLHIENATGASCHTVDAPNDGSWDLEIPEAPPETRGGDLLLPAMPDDSRIALRALALELGVCISSMRKKANKIGCLIEKRWLVAGSSRQACLVTDPAGAEALRRWFAR